MIAGLAPHGTTARPAGPDRDRLRLTGLERQLRRRVLADRQTGQCDRLADRRDERPCVAVPRAARAAFRDIGSRCGGRPSAPECCATDRSRRGAAHRRHRPSRSRSRPRAQARGSLHPRHGSSNAMVAWPASWPSPTPRGVRGCEDHVAGRAREPAGLAAEVAASVHTAPSPSASAPAPQMARSRPRRSPWPRGAARCARRKPRSRR